MVIRDKKHFMRRDKGGSIYKFSSDGFTSCPHKDIGENEWVSKDPVTPIEKTDFESALEAMIENGVQVFFVDKKTFNRIIHDSDSIDIIKSLESENKDAEKMSSSLQMTIKQIYEASEAEMKNGMIDLWGSWGEKKFAWSITLRI
jgi:hypothetical protein